MHQSNKKKPKRLLFAFCGLCLLLLFLCRRQRGKPLVLHQAILVQKGDTFARFTSALTRSEKQKVKLYTKLADQNMEDIAIGLYRFSWSYTLELFCKKIQAWPENDYIAFTVLEGRSIYDIDRQVSMKWLITTGAFISAMKDKNKIRNIADSYPFLSSFSLPKTKEVPETLEWFLYPDTYFIDTNKPFIDQMLSHHLTTFAKKIRTPNQDLFLGFTKKLQDAWFSISLSPYGILTLASIIEKEEKNSANKPTIAGIFLHRLEKGMRIDADISLCYGLGIIHTACTPAVIVKYLDDEKNLYNTRARTWIPPTPIASPSADTINALLMFKKTENIYYLHDGKGNIHYAETIQDHNLNKSKYISP